MKKILIVVHRATDRIVLTRLLEREGYKVESVSAGRQALIACANNLPHLVMSEVKMPDMDGLEICRRLRATPLTQLTPLIFLSSQTEVEERIKGFLIGADDYLTKPIHRRELIAKIEAQLERSRRIKAEIIRLKRLAIESFEPLPPDSNSKATSRLTPTHSENREASSSLPLTRAEERVFREVIQGFNNKQISERLEVSTRTVQTHLSNILKKLHLENRFQIIRFGYERGIAATPDRNIAIGDYSTQESDLT
ncbi:MAG TPA: response regulator [Allocoleopsis sp.]